MRIRNDAATVLMFSIVLGAGVGACTGIPPGGRDWAAEKRPGAVSVLTESAKLCPNCLVLSEMVAMGDPTGMGYVEQTTRVIRDSLGRYWTSQGERIKVFDDGGRFLTEVGRGGRGPLEFSVPIPVHAEASGTVHIIDAGNSRVTLVDSSFSLVTERSIPAASSIQHAVVLREPEAYVLNMWLGTAEGVGLPIHVIKGGEVVRSFGASEGSGPQTPFSALRKLAVDSHGRIFSAKRFDYSIEVWTADGNHLVSFHGPALNYREVKWGFYNFTDNPLPNEIVDIVTDKADRLFVLSKRVIPNWRDHFSERMYPNGLVGLQLRRGATIEDVYRSRIDVIDLGKATIVARWEGGAGFSAFVGSTLVLENRVGDDDVPRLVVWQMKVMTPSS